MMCKYKDQIKSKIQSKNNSKIFTKLQILDWLLSRGPTTNEDLL